MLFTGLRASSMKRNAENTAASCCGRRTLSRFHPQIEPLEDRTLMAFDIMNLGVDISAPSFAGVPVTSQINENSLVAFAISESGQNQTDLNGDGDAVDHVLHLFDVSTSATRNVGLAATDIQVSGNLVVFPVVEYSQGNTDLNDDGDTNDRVLHVLDASTGITTNLGFNTNLVRVSTSQQTSSSLVAFLVIESSRGENADFNGDGDTADLVAHVYDAATGITTNLGLAASLPEVNGQLVTFAVSEAGQGGNDLNGDGDTSDTVLHAYDAATGTTTNLGVAADYALINGNLWAFGVSESAQGNTDLNGDGDALDYVIELYDASTGTMTNLGLPANSFNFRGNLIAVPVPESAQGNTDLNSDEDTSDDVLHVYDVSTGITTNLGLNSSTFTPRVNDDLVLFSVRELAQGNTDLNGDGDAFDLVPHVYNASTGTAINLGLDSDSAGLLSGNQLGLMVSEFGQGNSDLNGDGDTSDVVLHLYDVLAGNLTNLGLVGDGFSISGDRWAFNVSEGYQGNKDLNGDGDALDNVVHVLDASTGSITNLGLDGSTAFPLLNSNFLAFAVLEAGQGNTDLNGDGDTGDFVLHIVLPRDTPVEQIEAITEEIRTLVGSGDLTGGQGQSLAQQLNSALAKLKNGDTKTSLNLLKAAKSHLISLVEEGELDDSDGQSLIEALNSLIDELEEAV